jgi:RAB protein geranylgeranyltransferase component A
MMNTASILLSFLLALLGLSVAAFAYRFLKVVQDNSEQAMASFQLHPDETVSEFRLLYYGLMIEFVAFIIYGIGGLIDEMILLNIGRAISAVFILIGMKISVQWWRRFT